MRDLEIIKKLVGSDITEKDLRFVDCYVSNNLGVFIPSMGECGYAARNNHTHPSYMVAILFDRKGAPHNHYCASITAPEIAHNDCDEDYYCIFIDKTYFENVYLMYSDKLPECNIKEFFICSDVLRTLNMFAFEYSKQMQNSDITLGAQATLITHWIIRSIIGESMDMRAISGDDTVARIQRYIESHYGDKLTITQLADMSHVSESSLARAFQREFGTTIMKYISSIRIEKSKLFLRRTDIPITEIAQRCGFGSSSHFTQTFKGLTGVTPDKYRKSYEK